MNFSIASDVNRRYHRGIALVYVGPVRQGFASKSAKPTNDNSPPIHRWDWDGDIGRVRETDG